MNRARNLFITFLCLLGSSSAFSQERILYKQVDSVKLYMERFSPEEIDVTKKYPAIVFFFGGGWSKGSIKQFEPHAKYFSKRGLVSFLVDYRVKNRHNTTPFESLKDAKSAIRYIKEHASEFYVDSSKIIAIGASAGGQLAAATALINGYNEDTDNLLISSKPSALVLFNPAIDNGPGGVGYERVKNDYKGFSPIHNIKKGAPPTIILSGTQDNLIPVATVKEYQLRTRKVGSRCELVLYEGKKHGFFNYNKFENYKKTLIEVDQFLQSLTYLKREPLVEVE